jgi:hypothetical protein
MRRLKADEMQALSGVLANGSDTAIAVHLAKVLDDPAICQFEHHELVRLVDELICLTFASETEVAS